MPNQRAKNKIFLGGFVDKKFHAQITRLAKQAGMGHNRFGFVTLLLEDSLKRKLPKSPESPPPTKRPKAPRSAARRKGR